MSTATSLYPPGPEVVPAELTRVSGAFRFRAALLITLIVVFFLLYAGLMFLAGYLLYLGIALPVYRHNVAGGVILKIFLIPTGLLLFLFLCRGFFRGSRRTSRSVSVEIFADEHPKLTAFLRRLCAEVGAPLPHRIFVDYEVNASAGYGESFLFLGKKNLYVGLGLVNALNLTEFKAVLAHEFAHISQKSQAVGNYAYLAMMVAENMVCGRDVLDELLDSGRNSEDWQIVAWPIWAVSEGLRYVFVGLFYGVLLMLTALKRQMEFHADRVAVSVAGSDAIVHSLKKLTFADAAMMRALDDLAFAAKKKHYTSDVFQQQDFAAERLRKEAKDPSVFDPPPLSDDPRDFNTVFSPRDEVDHPTMWADHPPNYQREDSAKFYYVRCPFDQRSPWLLFDNVEELRLRVTHRMYRVLFRIKKDMALGDARDVRSYVEEEYKTYEFDKRYHGLYDKRNINPGELTAVIKDAEATAAEPEQLIALRSQLYDDTTRVHAEKYNKLLEELQFLHEMVAKREYDEDRADRDFKFRGKYYAGKYAREMLRGVELDLEKENKFFEGLDRRVFLIHYRMAGAVDAKLLRDLKDRYVFHLKLQKIWSALEGERRRLDPVLALLDSARGGDIGADFEDVRDTFNDAHATLYSCVEEAKEMNLPTLKNLPAGEQLNRVLLEGKLVDGWVGMDYYIRAKWIRKFLRQFEEIQGNANHIHFKSLQTLLSLQDSIGRRFQEAFVSEPEVIEGS